MSASESTPLIVPPNVSQKPKPLVFPLYLFPKAFVPYLETIRLDKRNGIWLMLWPYVLGATFGAYRVGLPVQEYPKAAAQCVLSAFLSRSAACTINDIFDMKMDAGVERTKDRPMPSGRISVPAAYAFLLCLYTIGVLFFRYAFTTSDLAFWTATIQMIPLFLVYPLLKRVTYWPQAWLGLAIHCGFVAGWVKATNTLDYPLLAAWVVGGCCWTLLYDDTIYACQDIKDDVKVGVHSTAILFGTWIRPILTTFCIVFVSMLTLIGVLNHQGPIYFGIGVGGTVFHLLWQAATVNLEVPESCWPACTLHSDM